MKMNVTVIQGSYSFFRKAETPDDLVEFLNEVVHVGGTISIQTADTHYKCDMEDVSSIVEKWGIYKCRKGGCPSFQRTSANMLCYDCYEEKYRPDYA
jgi:hypothetical protein